MSVSELKKETGSTRGSRKFLEELFPKQQKLTLNVKFAFEQTMNGMYSVEGMMILEESNDSSYNYYWKYQSGSNNSYSNSPQYPWGKKKNDVILIP